VKRARQGAIRQERKGAQEPHSQDKGLVGGPEMSYECDGLIKGEYS